MNLTVNFSVIFLFIVTVTSTTVQKGTHVRPSGQHLAQRWLDAINTVNQGKKSNRKLYLNQGVEFVFPLGVHYLLANVNEQLWAVPTTGFEGVLEAPKHKAPLMFSSMINTLQLANFTAISTIYTKDSVRKTPPIRILGTDIVKTDFANNYQESWETINGDIQEQTNGKIKDFVPKGGFYGKAIYPFTKSVFINTFHYKNTWANPWKESGDHSFSDSPSVPFIETEGIMPFYENDAFTAVAVLFKSGTGSVVFLKPKGAITILQLMLHPNALTAIFDEDFPGWTVKQMKVKVPVTSFTTSTQHYDTLIKRGINETFCNYDFQKNKRGNSKFFLHPVVQTNHISLEKETMEVASASGVTLNSEEEFKTWSAGQHDSADGGDKVLNDATPEGNTERSFRSDDGATTESFQNDILDDPAATTELPVSEEDKDYSELSNLSFGNGPAQKVIKKGAVELYQFDQPFLWFLHATVEEPMFMGIVESIAAYKRETGQRIPGVGQSPSWLGDTVKGILWNCP